MAMPLVKQIGRVGSEYILELDPDQEALAMEIHDEALVFDLHLHGVVLPENESDYDEWLDSQRYPFAYEGLKHAGLNAFIDGFASMSHTWQLESAVREIGLRWAEMHKHPDEVSLALRADDVRRAKAEDRIAVFMVIENSELLGNDLDNLEVLYGIGVRSLGFSYNKRSLMVDGRTERTDIGVSDLGIDLIGRMNELGMIIDACHTGERSTVEMAEISEKPIIVSHTGARKIHETSRLASDAEMKAIAEGGGVIGIHSGVNVLSDSENQSVETMADHLDYAVNIMGIDHVCIGSDNYFGDKNAMHMHAIKAHAADGLQKYLSFNAEIMEGIESPSEWKNVTRVLVKRGYSRPDVEKLIGGNALRLVEDVIG
jgi:membrane dipeptidase